MAFIYKPASIETVGESRILIDSPAFDNARLEVARNQSVSDVARQNDDADQILFREFQEIVYGPDSPYAAGETFKLGPC